MFELTESMRTKGKMINVVVLSQKNRQPDENPGAKLSIEVQLQASMLAHFAPKLPGMLFEAPAGAGPAQGALEGVAPASDTPNLTEIGLKVGKLLWSHEMTGYLLEIAYGTGRKESNLNIKDSILSNWRLMPKEGGTVIARFDCESADISPETFGKLAKLKSRDIEIAQLKAPVVTQQSIERDAIPPAPARKPGPAERAAVDKTKGVDASTKPPHKETKAELSPEAAWPFPKGDKRNTEKPPQSTTTEVVKDAPARRPMTERGRKKMEQALAAGAAKLQ